MRTTAILLVLTLATPAVSQALDVIRLKKPTPTVEKKEKDDKAPGAEKTKTTPEERGLEGPPHNENADAPAWGWGKDKKPKPTPIPTKGPSPRVTATPVLTATPRPSDPVTVLKPVTIVEVVTVEAKPVTLLLVVTPTPNPASPVTVTKPVTVQVVVTATPVKRKRVIYRRVPAPTPTPRPRITPRPATRTTASSPSPCGVGWVWDLGFSVGADKKNDSLRDLWQQGVPEGLGWGGDAVNSSLETALMLRLAWFHIGGFFNWHFWSLGSSGEQDGADYDLSLDALSYGLKMRFKDCRFPLLADIQAGELSLSGARFKAEDAEGTLYDLALKGRAPYARIDLGWDFAPAKDLDLILSVGYQRALMEKLEGKVLASRLDPTQVGSSGTLVSDVDGKNIRADFSGPRVGLTLSLRF